MVRPLCTTHERQLVRITFLFVTFRQVHRRRAHSWAYNFSRFRIFHAFLVFFYPHSTITYRSVFREESDEKKKRRTDVKIEQYKKVYKIPLLPIKCIIFSSPFAFLLSRLNSFLRPTEPYSYRPVRRNFF